MYNIPIKQLGLIVVIFLASNHSVVLANNFSFSTGTNFTSGKYGRETSTDIWYVPFTLRYRSNRSLFRITVPYISITGSRTVIGPGIGDGSTGSGFTTNSIPGFGDIGSNGGDFIGSLIDPDSEDNRSNLDDNDTETRVERRTQSGLGDIIVAYTHNLIYHRASKTAFDITGRIKIPTASSARRLGSGQVDYAVQGDLLKSISNFHLRATFGYRILGNPSGVNFRNVFYGGTGVGYRVSPKSVIGTNFNIGQSTVSLQDSRTLSAYYSHRLTNNVRLNIYGLKGLSNRSPDWGSGITLRYIF
ncbi:MAG: hypothetical protein K0U40_05825 [Betaproteobacteria bacterium]|nr:hypothetical protein [Betaproteobacteria bacterium]